MINNTLDTKHTIKYMFLISLLLHIIGYLYFNNYQIKIPKKQDLLSLNIKSMDFLSKQSTSVQITKQQAMPPQGNTQTVKRSIKSKKQNMKKVVKKQKKVEAKTQAKKNSDSKGKNNRNTPLVKASALGNIGLVPIYPPRAIQLGEEGKVVVKVLINSQLEKVKIELSVASQYSLLNQAAIDSIKNWKIPANLSKMFKDNKEVWVELPINYSLS